MWQAVDSRGPHSLVAFPHLNPPEERDKERGCLVPRSPDMRQSSCQSAHAPLLRSSRYPIIRKAHVGASNLVGGRLLEATGTTPRERRALAVARERLCAAVPGEIAQRAGVPFGADDHERGSFLLPFLGGSLRITYPEGAVTEPGAPSSVKHAARLIALHYLVHADGHPLADRWVSFRELPDGLIYASAFQARVGPALLSGFGQDMARFEAAARTIGGSPIDFGDSAFMFAVLPRVRMAIVFYLGDEELASTVNVLYDGASGHFLPTEDLAVLGGLLVGALYRATQR